MTFSNPRTLARHRHLYGEGKIAFHIWTSQPSLTISGHITLEATWVVTTGKL